MTWHDIELTRVAGVGIQGIYQLAISGTYLGSYTNYQFQGVALRTLKGREENCG